MRRVAISFVWFFSLKVHQENGVVQCENELEESGICVCLVHQQFGAVRSSIFALLASFNQRNLRADVTRESD